MALPETLEQLDAELENAPYEIGDAWRVVRGYLCRKQRPSSQVSAPADAEEPITAKQHFAKTLAELKKIDEP